MKKISTIVLVLCLCSHFLYALPPADRKITKGTIFNYNVKEGALAYKVKLTVAAWDEDGDIKLQWQATGAKVMKGVCVQPHNALVYATKMKMQLQNGNENLPEDCSRWFAGYAIYDALYNDESEADVKMDDKAMTLEPNAAIIEKKILYNNAKTAMPFIAGKIGGSNMSIGFIEYAEKVILLENYSNGNVTVTLVSIEDPEAKAVAKQAKTLDDMVKELTQSMAPTKPVPLKKMEAAKFAKVKMDYPALAAIENYDGTNSGKVKKPITETYEYRYGSSSPNPPSLVDCLTADLHLLYGQRNKFGITVDEPVTDKSLPSAAAKKLLGIYLTTDFMDIPGYRPWTHWRFVKSLNETQRNQLAIDLEGYIAKYGFTE